MFYFGGLGIIGFAIVVTFIRSTVLESMERTWRDRENQILKKVSIGLWRTVTRVVSRRSAAPGTTSPVGEKPTEETIDQTDDIEETDFETAILQLKAEHTREFRSQVRYS